MTDGSAHVCLHNRTMLRQGQRRGESGQVAVESALILPLLIFFLLGLLQLSMMQHARLMTEYAAYQSARAGIVWNGHVGRMRDAAIVALLPTMGRTDDITRTADTWLRMREYDDAMRTIMLSNAGGVTAPDVNGAPLFGMVRVDTITPNEAEVIGTIWKLRGGANWEELDFDGVTGFPEVPDLHNHIHHFFNLSAGDDAADTYRRATVLSIRLRYWYELRIPFANWIIFTSWFASNAGVALSGSIDRPTLETEVGMTHGPGDIEALPSMVSGIQNARGYDTLQTIEMAALWRLSRGEVGSGPITGRRFFIPLSAGYSMRMQSNFYRKWSAHPNPAWGL